MIGYKIYYVSRLCLSVRSIAHNVKVLCAVWDLMHYTFNSAPMLIKGTNTDITTSAHIAQNTCYRLAGFSAQKLNRRTKEKSIKNERWQKWF